MKGSARKKPALKVVRPEDPPPDDDERPLIRTNVALHEVAEQAIAAIARDPSLFQRDKQLVRVIRTPELDADAWTLPETPQIRPLSSATLRLYLTRWARWEMWDKRENDWIPCVPPDSIVSGVLQDEEFEGVRPIVGVIEAPSLRPDGSAIVVQGYDTSTGFMYLPNEEFPT